jgi:TPR repeat protein
MAALVAALVVVAAAAFVVGLVHAGSAERQQRTATVVAADLAAAALVVTLLGVLVAAARRRHAATAAATAMMDADAAGTTGGRWPRLEHVPLQTLGVREPRTSAGRRRGQLPYVPRAELDRHLREVLGEHRFVLVHGPAGSGKSRSVAEICAALFGDLPAVIPGKRPGALARLLDSGVVPTPAAVWLDDLDRHVDAGVDADLLRRLLARPGVRLVATMRAAAYEQLKPSGDIRPRGRDVIELAEQIEYTGWDDDDRDEARRRLADQPDVTAALDRGTGLGEYLSVGPDLVDRLLAGDPPPEGKAVVYAAVDWYRAGMTRPAPADLLEQLYPHYLPNDDAALLDRYATGLQWATAPVSGARLITHRTDGTGITVHDVLLDHLTTTLPTGLPDRTWSAIAAALHDDSEALTAAGVTAYLSHRQPIPAEDLIRRAATAGNFRAMYNLGVLLVERGELGEAEECYRRAAAGHTSAMYNLGKMLQRRGESEEAEGWYRQAAAADDIYAMFFLGSLLAKRGEGEEAEVWYRKAAAGGHAAAMLLLAVLLAENGRPQEAEGWCRRAAAAGHHHATAMLDVLLRRPGRTE